MTEASQFNLQKKTNEMKGYQLRLLSTIQGTSFHCILTFSCKNRYTVDSYLCPNKKFFSSSSVFYIVFVLMISQFNFFCPVLVKSIKKYCWNWHLLFDMKKVIVLYIDHNHLSWCAFAISEVLMRVMGAWDVFAGREAVCPYTSVFIMFITVMKVWLIHLKI